MTLTNRLNLPDAIVRAISNDPYHAGQSDYTATSLLKPARMAVLQKQFATDTVEDAADRLWSLFGQLGHLLLERAGGDELKEERLYGQFGQFKVSAQLDNVCLEKNEVVDFKFTTSWQFKNNQPPKPEFVQQMNIQAELLRRNGYAVNTLFIIGILRDWSKLEAQRNPDYPQAQVVKQPIPLWPSEQATAFINMRIADHEAAKSELPLCSPSEMWSRDDQWAVHKRGNKRAVKLFLKEDAAVGYADNLGEMYEVQFRPGERIRCSSYCSVNNFCDQYQQYKKEKTYAHAETTDQ